MTKALNLRTSDNLLFHLVDKSVISAIDVGEIPFVFSFPFQDNFDNNDNNWQPAFVNISNGSLNLITGSPSFAFLRSLFNPATETGNYELLLEVLSVTGTPGLNIQILDDSVGAGTELFVFTPDVPGTISTEGTFRYTTNITSTTAFNETTDLTLSKTGGGTELVMGTITINKI